MKAPLRIGQIVPGSDIMETGDPVLNRSTPQN